jgi:hypothetical protein
VHNPDATPEAVEELLAERDVGAVLYTGWASIDGLEKAAGEKLGRPRVKLCTWDELLEAAGSPGRGTPASPVRGG